MAVDLSFLGAGTSAVWTRAAARALLTADAVDHQLVTAWQSPFPGVYADAGYSLDPVQWAHAAVLASGGSGQSQPVSVVGDDGSVTLRLRAAACGRDAARVWGYPLVDDDDPATERLDRFEHDVLVFQRSADVTAPLVAGDARRHVLHRHSLKLFPGDLVLHDSGLWLTSPLRTAMDCARLLPFEAAVCVLDDGLRRKLFSAADLAAALELRAGRPTVGLQRAAVDAADGRAEAPSETLLRLVLRPGWSELEPQVRVYDQRGYPVRRFDLGDRTIRLGVEADGKRGHAGELMVARDRKRDRTTEPYGWVCERATWFEIRTQQDALRTRVYGVRDRRRATAA